MDRESIKFYYQTGEYTQRENERCFTVSRIEANGETKEYDIIKSTQSMKGRNVAKIGNNLGYTEWINHNVTETDEI